jgi:hypothetical protein
MGSTWASILSRVQPGDGQKADFLEISPIQNHLRNGAPMGQIGGVQHFLITDISH